MNLIGQSMEDRAYDLIVANGYEQHDRFPVLEAAWPTVASALPLFVAGPNQRLQTVCDALNVFLIYTGRQDEWLSLTLQAEAKAEATGDHHRAGTRAIEAAVFHFLREPADAFIACAGRAADHFYTAKAGVEEQTFALALSGLGHRSKQDYPAELANARKAVELWRSLAAESVNVVHSLGEVAEIERLMRDLPSAERDYREALRIARAVGHAWGVAYCISRLAGLALERRDWPEAEALAREAMPLAEKAGHNELTGPNHRRLAEALVRQGKRKEALSHAQQAMALYTEFAMLDLAEAQATLKKCKA
ncbi:MAG: hypothetical protein RL514_4549 [Verrucomicrobiota bacterium]|jgi:tetratricopeptide (TPR) repeat protein